MQRLSMFLSLLLLTTTARAQTATNSAISRPAPQGFARLVDEAWRAVDSTFYDPTFGGVDWAGVRAEFLARSYPSREAAYAGIRELLGRLGDRATRFLTPGQAAALLTEFSGQSHQGVGLIEVLSVDVAERSGAIVIVTPVPGGPAARAGLRPGDVVESVDGADAKTLGLAETMSRLRGPAGTPVDLTIRRAGAVIPLRIRRERIPALDPLEGFVRTEGGTSIGYIGLRQFTPDAPTQLGALLDRLEADSVAGYVLDLRNDPGGFVPSVQMIAGMFLGAVPIARIRGRPAGRAAQSRVGTVLTPLLAEGEQRIRRPVVVLVNEGSASAAEVLAGAFQDQRRGPVIGTHTFGKGLAHGFQPLSDSSAVMPTVGRLETVGGRDLLDRGILPDIVVEAAVSPVIDESVGVATAGDVQYRRAVEVLLERARRDVGGYAPGR